MGSMHSFFCSLSELDWHTYLSAYQSKAGSANCNRISAVWPPGLFAAGSSTVHWMVTTLNMAFLFRCYWLSRLSCMSLTHDGCATSLSILHFCLVGLSIPCGNFLLKRCFSHRLSFHFYLLVFGCFSLRWPHRRHGPFRRGRTRVKTSSIALSNTS
jgi:hypothetical protein